MEADRESVEGFGEEAAGAEGATGWGGGAPAGAGGGASEAGRAGEASERAGAGETCGDRDLPGLGDGEAEKAPQESLAREIPDIGEAAEALEPAVDAEAEAVDEREEAGLEKEELDSEDGTASERAERERSASLYKKLPHGPHGMDRGAVARNQRVRMYGAMIESVSRKGYAKTSVADVIALAGVSRRAFYEHFTNKASCFVATHDVVAKRTNKALLRGWESERGWENRLHAACRAMLDDIGSHPKSAHLVMVDVLGLGRKAYECMRSSNALFERSLVSALVLSPDGALCSPVAPRAIVGGMRQVLRTRIDSTRRRRIPALTDELLDWVGACRSPAVERLRKLPSPPPLGREQLSRPPRFLYGEHRRSAAMRAIVELTLEHGYEALTDPQIASCAGMTTEAFHKQFRTKEHCYLAVIEEFCTELHEIVLRSASRGSCWTEGVRLGMQAYIDHIARHAGISRLAFVEIFGLGPAMSNHATAVSEAFTDFLVQTGASPARAPIIAVEALTGAIWAVVGSSAASGRLRYLPSALDHLTFSVLAPYTGPRPAIEAIEEAHAKAGKRAISGVRPAHDGVAMARDGVSRRRDAGAAAGAPPSA